MVVEVLVEVKWSGRINFSIFTKLVIISISTKISIFTKLSIFTKVSLFNNISTNFSMFKIRF